MPRVPALLFAVALASAACASAPPPSWTSGTSPSHPTTEWLVAVGSGTKARTAAQDALGKLASQTAESTETAVIADTFEDEDAGKHWALAVMSLAPLRERLAAELSGIETKLATALASADAATPAETLLPLDEALGLAAERESLQTRIEKLGGDVPDATPALPARAELERRLAETRKQLPIEIGAWEMDPMTGETFDPLDELRRALAAKVLEMGFPPGRGEVGWGDDPTWLVVHVRLGLDRLRLPDANRLAAIHWDAAVEITDRTAGDEIVALLGDEGRATHLNETEARREARNAARAFVVRAFEAWLLERTAPSKLRPDGERPR